MFGFLSIGFGVPGPLPPLTEVGDNGLLNFYGRGGFASPAPYAHVMAGTGIFDTYGGAVVGGVSGVVAGAVPVDYGLEGGENLVGSHR